MAGERSLLPRVLAALAGPRPTGSDDTCLEKLLDWFRDLAGPAESEESVDPALKLVQDNPCLTEFFTSVLALPEPRPCILSFTLRLAGILAASENCFLHLQQEKLLLKLFGRDGPLSSSEWEDASVRSGWLEGVCSMMCHQPALHFICSGGGIDVIFALQGDSSLFVASLASSLLVQMLILSTASETTEHLSSEDCDWPACAQIIIKHIEDSLQSSSASYIEQSLKLLTILFRNCHATWTEAIWLGIAKQIESFLTEKTVQEEHMLANLLLNVARSPVFRDTSSFWALVTSALEHLNPVHAGPLAVGILKRYRCPRDVNMKALTVLLQPMDCILRAASQPLECAGLLAEPVSDPTTVESLLSSKSSCVNLLCQTLTHLEELLSLVSLPVDLPCVSLLRSVLTMLQFCNGTLSPASPLGSTISRILINCFRVQRSALDVLTALAARRGCRSFIVSPFDVLLAYLESPNTNPTVLTKTLKATSEWLVKLHCWSCSNNQPQQAEKIFEDSDAFGQLLLSLKVPGLIENLLEDPESYVRASAVTAFGHLAFINGFTSQSPVEENQYNNENMVTKLQEILSSDPEVFPRRAVISFFNEWLTGVYTGELEDTVQFVSRVIQTVQHDPDWEVRLGCLELVSVFCRYTICQLGPPEWPYAPASSAVTSSTHQSDPLQVFCRAKLFSFLFQSVCDCDKPVAEKACFVLLGLSTSFCPTDTLKGSGETGSAPAEHGIAWLQRTLKQGSLAQNFPIDGGNGVDFQDPECMMLALGTIDLKELHDELNKSSDHVEKSPQSLLQDILATVGTTEENEADCY